MQNLNVCNSQLKVLDLIFSVVQILLIQILKRKFTVLFSLNSDLLKTFFINKVFNFTYAQLLKVTFKHLLPWVEFANSNQILNFHRQCKEKIIWEPGVTASCTDYLLCSFLKTWVRGHSKLAAYREHSLGK